MIIGESKGQMGNRFKIVDTIDMSDHQLESQLEYLE